MTKIATTFIMVVVAGLLALNATYVPKDALRYCIKDQADEAKLRSLMSDALDQAFKEHMAHLFDIWIKEQAETPERAIAGAQIGVSAYTRAQKNLAIWTPVRCK